MTIAECYDLSVQCDNKMHILPVRAQFTSMTRRGAHKAARDAGWKLTQPDGAICPHCAYGRAGLVRHFVRVAEKAAK